MERIENINPEKHFPSREEMEEINRALGSYGVYDARIDFFNFNYLSKYHPEDNQWAENPDIIRGED